MWRKLGQIFDPLVYNSVGWFVTHAALPVAEHRGADLYRIYFSGRDKENRARIGWFEINIHNPFQILSVSPQPVIDIGKLGTFDDHGVTSSCIVQHKGRWYQYYSGWTLGVTVPFYFFIGLAISDDGQHFSRCSRAPVMGRHKVDPYLLGSPSVLIEGDLWRMWYISATEWRIVNGKPQHFYLPKYAESHDGIHWERTDHICLDFADETEYAFARPHVIKEEGLYKMWYAVRGNAYRIGYAESRDGLVWTRLDDKARIEPSPGEWDGEMIEYPFIFDHGGTRYMLYNGNDYGRTGIGLAIWQSG